MQKARKMAKQDENVTFWKIYGKLLLLHLFVVIYDQIMSSLITVSNYALGYIQIPLKNFLMYPSKKNSSEWFVTVPLSAFTGQKLC